MRQGRGAKLYIMQGMDLNKKFGGDPVRGVPKELTITFTFGDRPQRTRVYHENNVLLANVNLPGSFSPLVITSAKYGAGDSWLDVTDKLQQEADIMVSLSI